MAFVVDASVAMGWLLPSQANPLTVAAENSLTHQFGWVPSHFGIEIARALRRIERRRLITPQILDATLGTLHTLPLKQDPAETLSVIAVVVALARRHTLRVDDASYLELALRMDLPLATRGGALAQAARAAGVELFRP